jgi:hypothetical protein
VLALLETRRVFVALLALGLFAMAARGVTDPDVWWHLRTGQLMLLQHGVFHTDPYSFTRSGQPWISHEWLSEILMFGLYRLAGFGGLIVLFAAITAGTFLLVFSRSPGRPYLAGFMTLWGAAASGHSWGVRPQMLSLLLASAFLWLLEASENRPRLLWWTAPLMLMWVNLHGGFPLGLALLALFLGEEALEAGVGAGQWPQSVPRIKNLAVMFAVCLGMVPLNPNGTRLYSYPFETLRSSAMQRFIQEWSSPNFHDPTYLPLLVMLLALTAGLALSRARLRPRDLVLLLATIPAALRSTRHIPILMLVMIPVLSRLAEAWLQQRRTTRLVKPEGTLSSQRTLAANVLVLIAFAAFATIRIRHLVTTQGEAEAKQFPQAGAAFLKRERPAGPILNHYNWGGYFIWTLYPQYRVFIDGRADVYGDPFMEAFGASYYLQDDWSKLLQGWGIRTLVLPPDAPLISALRSGPDWKQVYADSQTVVLTRSH